MNKQNLLKAEELLNEMSKDEYNAPDQYQDIIDLLPPSISKPLKINQAQERQHYRRVNVALRKVRKELEK